MSEAKNLRFAMHASPQTPPITSDNVKGHGFSRAEMSSEEKGL